MLFEFLLIDIPNDYTYKKQYLDQNASEIETLILGPSHTFAGLRPEFIDGHTFNASIGGQSFPYDYKIFKKYRKDFNSLKTIILSYSYPTLWFRLKDHHINSSLIFNYEKYYGIEPNQFIDLKFEVLNRPLKLNYRFINQYYIKNKSIMFSQKFGWGKKNKKQRDLHKTGLFQADRQTYKCIKSDKNKKRMQESIKMFNSMLDWGKKNNVDIVLITTPAHLHYRENLNPTQLNYTIKTANDLVSHNKNCLYLNYLNDERFLDEDYRDAHHLNPSGAEKLSKLVNQKINEFNKSFNSN